MRRKIRVKLLHKHARLPSKNSEQSAGFDLFAVEDTVIPACSVNNEGQVDVGRGIVHIGIALQLPLGTVGRIASRSGMSTRFNIEVGAGWVDSDYRGEIKVELKNLSSREYRVAQGDRVAQLIVLDVVRADVAQVDSLDHSERGSQGFGSSGR